MKHTSGPWKLRPPSLTGFAIDTPKGMFLVSCSGIPKREEWEANGKLIAAAPTMYDYIERQAESCPNFCLVEVAKAIKKTKGERK